MYSRLITTVAGALLLASPAFAALPDKATGELTTAKSAIARQAPRDRVPRMTEGDREVNALNALEAAGYRNFNNLRPKGRDFVAMATKKGESFDVTVLPTGQIQAKAA